MAHVIFVHPDGTRETHTLRLGETVMDAALDNNVAGILGPCGGGCTCCTCHCYVESPWFEALPDPHPDEVDLLEYVFDPAPNSRLACQIEVSPVLDGITVHLPRRQI